MKAKNPTQSRWLKLRLKLWKRRQNLNPAKDQEGPSSPLQLTSINGIAVYTGCQDLLAWKFFHILETFDLRYLLKVEVLPDNQYPELTNLWDKITEEFDRLNGEHKLKNKMLDFMEDIGETNEILLLKACYELMAIGNNAAIKIINEHFGLGLNKITVENIMMIEKLIRRKEMKLQIQSLQDKGEDTKQSDSGTMFLQSLVQMSGILKVQLNRNYLTIGEWIFYDKECRKIIEASKPKKSWVE